MNTQQVAQDVAQGGSMLHYTPEPNVITFNTANREILRITAEGRLIKGEGLSTEQATQEAAKMLIDSFIEQINKMVDARVAAMKEPSK
jgi:hypothetical protein